MRLPQENKVCLLDHHGDAFLEQCLKVKQKPISNIFLQEKLALALRNLSKFKIKFKYTAHVTNL